MLNIPLFTEFDASQVVSRISSINSKSFAFLNLPIFCFFLKPPRLGGKFVVDPFFSKEHMFQLRKNDQNLNMEPEEWRFGSDDVLFELGDF